MQEVPTPPRCEVVILTALGLEYKAVSEHLQDMKEITHQGTVYGYGNFAGQHRTWHVAVAEIGMGGPTAATETERAISYFRPQITLFVGVGGGLKDVKLGDVVAASKVYAYESGKVGQQFQPRPEAWRASHALEQRARAEARNDEWLTLLGDPYPDPIPEVHIGALAAGEKVLASTQSDLFRLLKATYGDTLAVEMEGHGFLAAVHANHSVHALVIRGISDLIDDKSTTEATGSQIVAARYAAAFAFQVLARYTPPEQNNPSSTALPPEVQHFISETTQNQEYIQRALKRLNRLEQQNRIHCPSLFILVPTARRVSNPKDWTSHAYRLRLLCQYPAAPHLISDEPGYELRVDAEWSQVIAPWLKLLKNPFGKPLEEERQRQIDLLNKLNNELADIDGTDEAKEGGDYSQAQELRPTEGAALRALYHFLDQADPSHYWHGLHEVMTPDGATLWLCEYHKKVYNR